MTLHFLSFEVQPFADNVKVYDGDNASAPLLETLTGSISMLPWMYHFRGVYRLTDLFSSGSTVFVSFVTNSYGTRNGFKIVYSTVNPGKAQQ